MKNTLIKDSSESGNSEYIWDSTFDNTALKTLYGDDITMELKILRLMEWLTSRDVTTERIDIIIALSETMSDALFRLESLYLDLVYKYNDKKYLHWFAF